MGCSVSSNPPITYFICLALLSQVLDNAGLAIITAANLLRLVASVVALVHVARLAVRVARVADGAGITVVGVDAAQDTAVDGDDVVDADNPGSAVARAVAAAADELAKVLDVEVADGDGDADAVDLDDLVGGVEGTAAGDGDVAALLEGDGVFAHVLEPDVGDGAGAKAVDALGLVGADDDVGDGGAVLEDEDGVVAASLLLFLADNG